VLPNLDARCSGGGPIPAQCYVAEFDGHWYAAAIWTGPVNRELGQMGDRILELRRFAIVDVAPRNTASRMLAYMVRDLRRSWPTLERFVSYQATAHHDGTIYKAAGWQPVGYTRFARWSDTRQRGRAQTVSDKVRWELVAS